jgi:hypothetical protein
MPEIVFKPLFGIWRQAKRPDMNHFGVEESLWIRLRIFNQFAYQILGFSTRRGYKYPVSPVNMSEDVFRSGELFRKLIFDTIERVKIYYQLIHHAFQSSHYIVHQDKAKVKN